MKTLNPVTVDQIKEGNKFQSDIGLITISKVKEKDDDGDIMVRVIRDGDKTDYSNEIIDLVSFLNENNAYLGTMKTSLPAEIRSIEHAKLFLKELHTNRETFHPEDDAHTIQWNGVDVTPAECDQLNKLMKGIYNLPGNENYPHNVAFDPCEYLIELDNEKL